MTTACDVIACARRFAGVRFAHQGRTKNGLDCLGLLIAVAGELGLRFGREDVHGIDVPQYGARPDTAFLKRKLDQYLIAVDLENIAEGDVVLLKIDGSPQHLAVISDYPMTGELGMIHAYAPAHQVVEHRYDPHWRKNSYAAYRLPQLV